MVAGEYQIGKLALAEDAERIVQFLLSDSSFDDTRYTPGELAHFSELPYQALEGKLIFWYAVNEAGDIIAINSVAENEQLTSGYSWDYIVVHRDYRKTGIASSLIAVMNDYLVKVRARYIVTYTCDLPEYNGIRRLFERSGFSLVGRCPDYYFDGEDRLIYYRKLSGE